jgi:pimeloyl-ACP methyl ester carboxylesterase
VLATRLESVPGRPPVRLARLGTGPPLVFLHGYPDNLQIWSSLAPRLADRFEVIAFDWPGMGQSEDWGGGTTPAHMAERLLVLLDAWRLERVGLVGIDMGGQPALVFAALHPERTRELVVMNSLVFHDEETSWEIGLLRRFGANRFLINRLPGPVFRRAVRTFLPAGETLAPELRADFWGSFRRPAVRRFVAKMCAGYQGTLGRLPALYPKVACPTLVLWAERDKHFPLPHARRLQAAVAGSRLEVVPGAEHWMVLSRPVEIADRIRAFSSWAAGPP